MKSSMQYREYIEILKKLKEKNFHQEYYLPKKSFFDRIKNNIYLRTSNL